MSRPRLLATLLLLLVTPALTGCWDNREPTRRAFAVGVAVDPDPEDPERIIVTAQMPAPGLIRREPVGGATGFLWIKAEGRGFFEASERLQDKVSREIFWGQCRVIVLSTLLSPEQVADVISTLMRAPDKEPSSYLVVAEGSAAALMTRESPQERFPALKFETVFEAMRRFSVSDPVQLWEASRSLWTKGIELAIPAAVGMEGEEVSVTGLGVYKGTRLMGILDVDLMEGYTYMLGQVRVGMIHLKEGETAVSIRSIQATRQVEVTRLGPVPAFRVRILVTGELASTGEQIRLPSERVRNLERQAADQVTDRVNRLMVKLQNEYNSDVVGLGKLLHYRYPEYFRQLDWDETFPQVEVDVQVEMQIRRKGLLL